MKRFAIGLLVVLVAAVGLGQQQTPDCQDIAFAKGYRSDEPSFVKRTAVAHARDADAGAINRTPAPLALADVKTKKYPGALIPEFEQGGKRLAPDETQVWEITGKVTAMGGSAVNLFGFGSQDFTVCDSALKNCIAVSLSPPECVGDSVFGAEMLAVWTRQITEEIKIGSFFTFRGPAYWCCQNSAVFNLKPIIDFVPAADPGDPGSEPVPVNPPDVTIQLPANIAGQPLVMGNGESNEFGITTTAVSSFNGDVELSVWSDALESDNFSVTVSPQFIPAPGRGEAQVKINTSPTTFPRDYLVTISALANDKTFNTTFLVKVTCDPPAILGIHQPRDATVNPGVRATFEVTAAGTGPFQYQWFRGRRGSTVFPIASSNSNRLEVTGVDDINSYWVRVSNACGTVDSNTVTIAPSRLRAVRR